MEEDELNKRINKLIQIVPLYGEFEYAHPDVNLYTGGMQEGIFLAYSIQWDKEALEYLANNGFVANRNDIKVSGKSYLQLTDKGRKLKECASIQEYHLLVLREKEKLLDAEYHQAMEYQRNKFLFWISVSLGISTAVSAVYYLVQLWDGTSQKHHCIVVSTIAIVIAIIGIVVVLQAPRKRQ